MKTNLTNKQKKILKAISYIAIGTAMIIACLLGTESCTATRTIVNQAQYIQRGDTTFIIQTKTTENYNAKKSN